jgi:hypothetical protein
VVASDYPHGGCDFPHSVTNSATATISPKKSREVSMEELGSVLQPVLECECIDGNAFPLGPQAQLRLTDDPPQL